MFHAKMDGEHRRYVIGLKDVDQRSAIALFTYEVIKKLSKEIKNG